MALSLNFPITVIDCKSLRNSYLFASRQFTSLEMKFSKITSIIMALGNLVGAHPGEDHTAELAFRHDYFKRNSANLAHCGSKLSSTGVSARSVNRRSAVAHRLKEKRGLLTQRGEHQVVSDYTNSTDPAVLFSSNSSCALAPEEIVGPYCIDNAL